MQVSMNYPHRIDRFISENSESKESLAKCILSSCKNIIYSSFEWYIYFWRIEGMFKDIFLGQKMSVIAPNFLGLNNPSAMYSIMLTEITQILIVQLLWLQQLIRMYWRCIHMCSKTNITLWHSYFFTWQSVPSQWWCGSIEW